MKLGFASFNARAETVETRPGFRDAWKRGQRCLVIADGFYEWRKPDKQPFFVSLGNKQPMTFAGLWDQWKPKDGEPVRSCTIITTEANDMMAPIHDRMPVILGAEDWAAWLGEEPLEHPITLLRPFPPERMTMWPVSKAVGNVTNQGAELAEPVAR
jgi:putative SOS response-associated peptidase YedK